MARCPSCNQFASNDLEVDDVSADCDGDSVEITTELSLMSACCGDTMATAAPSDSLEIPGMDHTAECDEDARQFSVEITSEDPTDWFEGKGRGARHFYGVDVFLTITCDECGAEGTLDCRVGEQASSFDAA